MPVKRGHRAAGIYAPGQGGCKLAREQRPEPVMKKTILDRYPREADGSVAIDISTTRVADLYNNLDRTTPYARKELDPDLADYLTDCVREIGGEPFLVRFHFAEAPSDELKERIVTSLHNYFRYLRELEARALGQLLQNSAIYLAMGAVILFLAVWVNARIEGDASVLAHVFAEGLTVAAWVALWQGVAILLIGWVPHRRRIALFARVAQARVEFG